MQNHVVNYPHTSLLDNLRIIGGIKFTSREIDIMACLLSGKAAGIVASILGLSVRTIETHLFNIRAKLECNSRNGIIEFLERSEQLPLLKKHYQHLIIENNFQQTLKKISRLISPKKPIELIYDESQATLFTCAQIIKYHLTQAGFIIKLTKKNINHFSVIDLTKHLDSNLDSNLDIIFILNKSLDIKDIGSF